MDAELLKILCCPETRQPLRASSASELSELNERIRAGQVRNRADEPVTDVLEAGLTREDAKALYPVRRGLPMLLIAEAISIDAL